MGTEEERKSVTLRDFNEKDVNDFMAWAGDSEVAKYTTWHPFVSREKAQEFMEKVVIPHPWFKAICVNGKAIGHVKLEKGIDNNGSGYGRIAYATGREHWRRGIATEAVKEAVRMGWRELKLTRVEALVLPENIASVRVLEKTGFTRNLSHFEYVDVKGQIRPCFLFTLNELP